MMDAPLAWSGPYSPYIHHCDDAQRQRAWTMPNRRLEYWLLVTSLSGSESIGVDGHRFDVRPGDSYLIPPGALHDLASVRGNTPVWIHFDVLFDPRRTRAGRHHAGPHEPDFGGRAGLLQPAARATWGVDLPILVPAGLRERFAAEVPAVVALHRGGSPPARLAATARLAVLLAELVAEAWRAGGGAAGPSEADRIARAEAVARHRLDLGFGLHDFAAAAGLGRSRFCQVYRRLRGMPPGAFLQRERLVRAESLLRDTDLPVGQVATLVGYGDATVFVRAFRRARGLTPGAWRLAPGR